MAQTVPLQNRFDRMVRDAPRNALPKGACWTLENAVPNLEAPARTRGGYIHYSNDVNATSGSSGYIIAGLHADQLTTPKMICIDDIGHLFVIDTSVPQNNTVTAAGPAWITRQNPLQLGGMAIFLGDNGTTQTPRKYDTVVNDLGGGPPPARYGTVWKALLLLGNTGANPQRLYFSTQDYNPESWDLTNTFWDFSAPIVGLAAMRNAVLVFHENAVSRLLGTTPPPGGDLKADDPLFNVGTFDARSIATWNEQVVWANKDAIYITDGIVPNDLTQLAGMKSYWRDLMANYDNSIYSFAGGVIQNHYVFSIMNRGTFIDAGMIDLQRYNWVKLTNIDAYSMWRTTSLTGSEKLFFGRREAAFVGELSTIFSPGVAHKNDGDGTAVQMMVETPFYELSNGIDSFRRLFVTYDLVDAASDDPEFFVTYVKTPKDITSPYDYVGIQPSLQATTTRTRQKLALGYSGQGLGLRIQQFFATGDGRLWSLEVDGHAREASRLT